MNKLLLLSTALCGVVLGGASNLYAQTASPGSITVRLNGRVNWYAGVEGSSLDTNTTDGTKTNTANFYGYLRLFPGFDGVAANGLHYGAAAAIWENGGSSASSETLYVYQAYGYIGLPQLGQISVGQQVGPSALFETGTVEGFNDGGWNGDIEAMVPLAANPVFPYPDSGAQYDETTNKIVYLSPTIGGFQFGIGFTPNYTTANDAPAPTTSATPIVGGQPRNMLDIGGQYTKTFGAVAVQAGLDYTFSGQVQYSGAAGPTAPASYHDLRILGGGATVTWHNITLGGSSYYGNYNMADGDTFDLEPSGGSAAVAWLAGVQYASGPWVLGASFFRTNETGNLPGGVDAGSGANITDAGLTSGQQQDNGLAAGLTYTLVPGVSLFADYLYGTRQQGGYNFQSGNAGADHNTTQAQLFGVGTQIQW